MSATNYAEGWAWSAIGSAGMLNDPYPILAIRDLFPVEMFAEMQASIPNIDTCEPLSTFKNDAGETARYRHLLRTSKDDVWEFVYQILTTQTVADALFTRLGCADCGAKVSPIPMLYLDLPGYNIPPHTDMLRAKFVTMGVYLNDSPEDMGTAIYTGKDRESLQFKMPFETNSGYSFRCGENTWHGVEPIESFRASIMLIYYYTDYAKKKGLLHGKPPVFRLQGK